MSIAAHIAGTQLVVMRQTVAAVTPSASDWVDHQSTLENSTSEITLNLSQSLRYRAAKTTDAQSVE